MTRDDMTAPGALPSEITALSADAPAPSLAVTPEQVAALKPRRLSPLAAAGMMAMALAGPTYGGGSARPIPRTPEPPTNDADRIAKAKAKRDRKNAKRARSAVLPPEPADAE